MFSNKWLHFALLVICSMIVAYCTITALRSQYISSAEGKTFFVQSNAALQVTSDMQVVIEHNSIFTFRRDGKIDFHINKYQDAPAEADGVTIQIYADQTLISSAAINPYIDDSFPYIDHGAYKRSTIAFDIPKNTKRLVINILPNGNNTLDHIVIDKQKLIAVNIVGAVIYLLSLIILITLAIYYIAKTDILRTIRIYLADEERAKKIYYISIGIFLLYSAYAIIVSSGWSLNQNGRFLVPAATNDIFTYFSDRSDGRYFPLANTDINILKLIPYGNSSSAMYFHNMITFSILIIALLYLFSLSDRDKIASRYINICMLFGIMFSYKYILRVFCEIIYPERLLALTVVLFLIAYKKALDTNYWRWFALALIVAVYATFQKEIMFGVFIVIAVFAFMYGKRTFKENIFNLALILNAVVFLLSYYVTIVRNATEFYAVGSSSRTSHSIYDFLIFFAQSGLLVLLMLIIAVVRIWYILRHNDRKHLFYDVCLLSAAAFAFAYFILGFIIPTRAYIYFAPALLLFAPALVYWSKELYYKGRYALFGAIIIVLILAIRPLSLEMIVHDRRASFDIISAVTHYAKLGKRIIIYNSLDTVWQNKHIIPYINYINSREYTLENSDININIYRQTQDEPIDENAIYLIWDQDYEAAEQLFSGFRKVIEADGSNFTLGLYMHK
ncbi:hypothetical protein FACS1894103_5520 [Campylobacterota bacterium]|nr:hypothetical protein FACS1894103_5520 [Campylobacterota bacterium]